MTYWDNKMKIAMPSLAEDINFAAIYCTIPQVNESSDSEEVAMKPSQAPCLRLWAWFVE